MNFEIDYIPTLKCDRCGAKGAYDFLGDFFCENCIFMCEKCNNIFVKISDNDTICNDCKTKKHRKVLSILTS